MTRNCLIITLMVGLSGCILTGFRQQATELSLVEVKAIRQDVEVATKAVVETAQEVKVASQEGREADIAKTVSAAATALSSAHEHCDVAGRVLSVMQSDLGRSEKPLPQGKSAIVAWCARYRMTSEVMQMAASFLASRVPLVGLGGIGKAKKLPVEGWSPTTIAALISAALAAVGAGEGTRRGVRSSRRKRADKDAQVSEALAALDEIKEKHPTAVKKATDKARRPHLRTAFVQREKEA